MKKTAIIFLLCVCSGAMAQVQSTADTLGKGKSLVFGSANVYFTPEGISTGYLLQGWRGVSSRVDVFGGLGLNVIERQKQLSINAGANVNLAKIRKANVSAFNMVSAPMNRRRDASTLVWLAAGIISREVGPVTPYSGYSATVPIGRTADKLFTSPDVWHNVFVGVAKTWKKWTAYAEYDFGQVRICGPAGAFAP